MEEGTSDITTQKGITRRSFLKVMAVTFAAAYKKWEIDNGPAQLMSSFLARDIYTEIPPEFKDNPEEQNPYFKNPESIVEDSLHLYDERRAAEPDKYPALKISRRENYISTVDVLRRYQETLSQGQPLDTSLARQLETGFRSLSTSGLDRFNQSTGGEIMGFSALSINGISDLIMKDPGSGYINRAIQDAYHTDRKTFYARHSDGLTRGFVPPISDPIKEKISNDLQHTLEYFNTLRQQRGEPIEIAEALTFFFARNDGDVYAGLWDSVLFFKLLVRNDFDSLEAQPTLDKSMLAADLFRDNFSPYNSINWLAKKYKAEGIDSNHYLASEGSMELPSFKDYMLINRSGGLYHCLNILTWSAVCMDPNIVQVVVPTYYSGEERIGADYLSEHGSIKIESDLIVAMKAPEIRQAFDMYIGK